MADFTVRATRTPLMARLANEARDTGVPDSVIASAIVATGTWIRDGGSDSVSFARARAYFWGVVRRRAFRDRSPGSAELRRRWVIASLVDDLRQAGADESRIEAEVRRCYGAQSGATESGLAVA